MKKIFSFLLVFTLALGFNSCVGDDIDDLQGQINDLNDKVDDLEASQDAALLAAIADMQTAIAALEGDVADQYAALLADLTDLEDVVTNNKDAIYYGNLITDADFDAFVAQGAEIVTGKVIVTKQSHADALAKAIMVGGNVEIKGGVTVTIPLLETVGGDLYITEMTEADATVIFEKLASVGGELGVGYNEALTSVSAPALVLIYEDLYMEDNQSLVDVAFTALDLVGELYINSGWVMLNSFDISATDVVEDAELMGFAGQVNVDLGVIGGHIYIESFEGVQMVSIANEVINGDLTLSGLRDIEMISIPNLTAIKSVGWNGGNLSISGLFPPSEGGGGIGIGIGLSTLKAANSTSLLGWTNNIVTIDGDVTVSGNRLTEMDAFNNVETVGGAININGNGNLNYMLVMDALASVGGNITIDDKAKAIDGFNSLTGMSYSSMITIVGKQTQDSNYDYEGECVVNGFSSLTSAHQITIDLYETTDFHAFAALESLTAYDYQTGVTIYFQNPDRVGVNGPVQLCEMQSFLENSVSANYGSEYRDADYNLLDPMVAIPQLTANCGGGGIGVGSN